MQPDLQIRHFTVTITKGGTCIFEDSVFRRRFVTRTGIETNSGIKCSDREVLERASITF